MGESESRVHRLFLKENNVGANAEYQAHNPRWFSHCYDFCDQL